MFMQDVKSVFVCRTGTVRDALESINRGNKGIALIVDDENRLLGTINDGDIRRAIISGRSLDAPAIQLLAQRDNPIYLKPTTAREGTDNAQLLKLMRDHKIIQIPLLDAFDSIIDLVTMNDLVPDDEPNLKALIMAGGFGTRLLPLTTDMPKPMLPVGDRPVMELVLDRLKHAGIKKVSVAAHYLSDKITEHFGDGSGFDVEMSYLVEDEPLGTAGALGLMDESDEPILIVNGDVLTEVDFRKMADFHKEQNADMTVGVRHYSFKVPFGVVECEGAQIRKVIEKPDYTFFVNAGLYLIEPSVRKLVGRGEKLDMTDLIELAIAQGLNVASFPIVEYWLDIGRKPDYDKAQDDLLSGQIGDHR